MPVATHRRARSGGVAGTVGVHLDTSWRDLCDLSLVVVEVCKGGDRVAIDGNKTWEISGW